MVLKINIIFLLFGLYRCCNCANFHNVALIKVFCSIVFYWTTLFYFIDWFALKTGEAPISLYYM